VLVVVLLVVVLLVVVLLVVVLLVVVLLVVVLLVVVLLVVGAGGGSHLPLARVEHKVQRAVAKRPAVLVDGAPVKHLPTLAPRVSRRRAAPAARLARSSLWARKIRLWAQQGPPSSRQGTPCT